VKTIIAGSRTITDYELVKRVIADSGFADEITEVLCGGANGVDACGFSWGRETGIPVKLMLPDWDTYGKAAGPFRNEAMAEYADALILVWEGKSKGSASMKRIAKRRGLRIYEHKVTA
jgi:hypothetical protein